MVSHRHTYRHLRDFDVVCVVADDARPVRLRRALHRLLTHGRVGLAALNDVGKLWDAATGREVLTVFGHEKNVHTVAFSPDGRLLATASVDGTVALHLRPIDELRKLATERVTRSLTDQECRQYLHLEACLAG